jgi:hypothetical protein
LLGLLPTVEVWYYTESVSLSYDVFLSAVISVLIAVVFIPVFAATPETILWVLTVSGLFAILYVLCIMVVVGFNREDVMVIEMAEEKYDISSDSLDYLLHRFQK